MRYSGYMREILQDYTDQVEAFGLDESWADVSGSVGLFGSAMTIAREISERVKRELGITVSIGVSDNKVTAKLGSDYKKPDAITRIEADNYKEIVYPLPVQDLLYVGHATQRKLNYYGIRTIGQLAQTNPETLHGWFGKVAIFAVRLRPRTGCLAGGEAGSCGGGQKRGQQRHHAAGPRQQRGCLADAVGHV